MNLGELMKKRAGLVAGPLAFIFLNYFFKAPQLEAEAQAVLACSAWIAIWWITEAIAISATALLPIVLFPLSGAMPLKEAVGGYSHPYIFLFIGGFVLALSMEKWNLHRRLALMIIKAIGSSPPRIILGFMLATAFLSMWISNTATTVMMLPIGLAIIRLSTDQNDFSKALMLAIAYSASIGGIATIIGTPPNLILAGVLEETYGVELSFMKWFVFGLPFALILLFISWYYISYKAFRLKDLNLSGVSENVEEQIQALGPLTAPEKRILIIFGLTAFAWISRSFLLQQWIPALDDAIIAIVAALILFIVPSKMGAGPIMGWEDMRGLPWGVLLLFGGGISLAIGFARSGLADWLGHQLSSLEGTGFLLLLLILVVSVNFLTEITSNLATTSVVLPILAPLALSLDLHPFSLMVAVAIAASCAFMLPVATPPNALVFGSGVIQLKDMLRTGIWLNLLSAILLILFVYFILPWFWGFDPGVHPENFG